MCAFSRIFHLPKAIKKQGTPGDANICRIKFAKKKGVQHRGCGFMVENRNLPANKNRKLCTISLPHIRPCVFLFIPCTNPAELIYYAYVRILVLPISNLLAKV